MTKARAPAQQRLERALDQVLGLRVEGRGWLVQNQDRGVLQQRPGDGDPLPLAARTSRLPRSSTTVS